MDAAADRPEFAPPEQDAMWRGFALAILAHVLLFVALTYGLRWQRESQDVAVEAELWSRVPQEAAPREVQPPPPAPTPPAPAPVVKAQPKPEPPLQKEADIALEREKQKRELEKQRQAELERERLLQQRKLEAQKKHEQELAKKREQEELAAKKKRDEELAKKKEQARLVAEAKRKEEEKKRKEQEAKEAREAKVREKLREDTIKRSLALAGTGAPSSTGSAAQSSGPSASWGARVQARVRPNIVFSDTVSGNPEAVVEVRLAPDGTIVSRRLKKSSGLKAWDEAVLRALDKTETLPRDTDGRVPQAGDLVFKPKG